MNLRKIGCALCCGLGFAALQCAAASSVLSPTDPSKDPGTSGAATTENASAPPPATEKSGSTSKTSENAAQQPAASGPRMSHRLKFRGPDGTCACDCASGGISEADIRKSQEAHQSASR